MYFRMISRLRLISRNLTVTSQITNGSRGPFHDRRIKPKNLPDSVKDYDSVNPETWNRYTIIFLFLFLKLISEISRLFLLDHPRINLIISFCQTNFSRNVKFGTKKLNRKEKLSLPLVFPLRREKVKSHLLSVYVI